MSMPMVGAATEAAWGATAGPLVEGAVATMRAWRWGRSAVGLSGAIKLAAEPLNRFAQNVVGLFDEANAVVTASGAPLRAAERELAQLAERNAGRTTMTAVHELKPPPLAKMSGVDDLAGSAGGPVSPAPVGPAGGGVRPHPSDPNIPGGPENYRGRFQAGLRNNGQPSLPDNYDVHHTTPQRLGRKDDPLVDGIDVHHPERLRGVPGSRQPGSAKVTEPDGRARSTNPHAEMDHEIDLFLRTKPTREELDRFIDYQDWRWGHTYWENRTR